MNCASIRQDDLIERYLCHQLDESASDGLETHMLGCPDCSRLVEDLQSLRCELEERAAIIRAAPAKQRRFLFWLPTVATGAAVVLVGLGLLHLWKVTRKPLVVATLARSQPELIPPEVKPSPDFDTSRAMQLEQKLTSNLADAGQIRLTSTQATELLRIGVVEPPPFAGFGQRAKDPRGGTESPLGKRTGTSDTGRVLFQSGMDAYVEGRYRDALDFLLNAARQDDKTDDVDFYLGICEILTGHLQDAQGSLETVVASGNSVYLQPAHYYLGKTSAQLMQLDKAEAEFREAASLPGRLTPDAKALATQVNTLRTDLLQPK